MSPFETIRHIDEDGNEYWSARELTVVLDYRQWARLKPVIQKAGEACENSGQEPSDPIRRVAQMVQIVSGAKREIEDYHLSRDACYLLVQNADPSKPVVGLGQTYFATQTRQSELADDAQRVYLRNQASEHNKTLAATAYEVGVVTLQDFAIFTDHGYMRLYNRRTRTRHPRTQGAEERAGYP